MKDEPFSVKLAASILCIALAIPMAVLVFIICLLAAVGVWIPGAFEKRKKGPWDK